MKYHLTRLTLLVSLFGCYGKAQSTPPGAPIFRIIISTPHNLEIHIDHSARYAGVTCNDMHLVDSRGEDDVSPGQIDVMADDLLTAFGPGMGCQRAEMTIKGYVFSTGDIQLFWDAQAKSYTQAMPETAYIELKNPKQ